MAAEYMGPEEAVRRGVLAGERMADALERIADALEAVTWHDTVDGQDGVRTYEMVKE